MKVMEHRGKDMSNNKNGYKKKLQGIGGWIWMLQTDGGVK
jgi:hypothetical protein